MVETLAPGAVTLETLARIYWDGLPARLDPAAWQAIDRARDFDIVGIGRDIARLDRVGHGTVARHQEARSHRNARGAIGQRCGEPAAVGKAARRVGNPPSSTLSAYPSPPNWPDAAAATTQALQAGPCSRRPFWQK